MLLANPLEIKQHELMQWAGAFFPSPDQSVEPMTPISLATKVSEFAGVMDPPEAMGEPGL